MKKGKKKRKIKSRKNGLKRALAVFYAVNAVITGVFLLYAGVTVAGRNTERNMNGTTQELFYADDIINAVYEFFSREFSEIPLV